MKLDVKALIVSFRELNIAREKDPERFVMEDALTELLDGIYKYGIQIINLDIFHADTEEKLSVVLSLHNILPKDCLCIGARDETLAMASGLGIASVGYPNPAIPGQGLYQADFVVEGFEEVDVAFLKRVHQRRHGIPWTVAETRRCILREIALEDLDALYGLYQDEASARYVEGMQKDREAEMEVTKAYIRNMYGFYGYGMWAAIEKSTGDIIGKVGLEGCTLHGEPALQLGYLVGKPYQNKGYATELCQAALAFAAEETGFEEINCLIQKENAVSIHLAEKLGFSWQEEVEIQGKTMQRYKKLLHFPRNMDIMYPTERKNRRLS